MTAQSMLCRLSAVAGASLIAMSAAPAETRLMSDPSGEVLNAAVLAPAPADANATAPASIANMSQGLVNFVAPVAVEAPAGVASAPSPPPSSASAQDPLVAGSAPELAQAAYAPAPSWLSRVRRFIAGVVQSSGK